VVWRQVRRAGLQHGGKGHADARAKLPARIIPCVTASDSLPVPQLFLDLDWSPSSSIMRSGIAGAFRAWQAGVDYARMGVRSPQVAPLPQHVHNNRLRRS